MSQLKLDLALLNAIHSNFILQLLLMNEGDGFDTAQSVFLRSLAAIFAIDCVYAVTEKFLFRHTFVHYGDYISHTVFGLFLIVLTIKICKIKLSENRSIRLLA
jgi:hypothetical protein